MSQHERFEQALEWLTDNTVPIGGYPEGSIGALRLRDRAERLAELIESAQQEVMPYYSEALDEIYRLRGILAYQAMVTDVHIQYKTFPKSRRAMAEKQVEQMRKAARGLAMEVVSAMPNYQPKFSLKEAGASETLTRAEFEREVDQNKHRYRRPVRNRSDDHPRRGW